MISLLLVLRVETRNWIGFYLHKFPRPIQQYTYIINYNIMIPCRSYIMSKDCSNFIHRIMIILLI